jgi:dihydrofolate reductase
MSAFMRSIDTKLLGRKTYEMSLRMGAKFDSKSRTIVFSRHAPPADAPSGVEFVNGAIGPFVSRLREGPGKDIWLMGGGDLIASFLDEQAIDEFIVSVAPVFIGDGIPLIARRHRHVPLDLQSGKHRDGHPVQLLSRSDGIARMSGRMKVHCAFILHPILHLALCYWSHMELGRISAIFVAVCQ